MRGEAGLPRRVTPVGGLGTRVRANKTVTKALTVCFTYPVLYRVSAESRAGCLAPSKLPPSWQPGSRADNSCKLSRPCLLRRQSSEDAGFLSHVHTDRPLGRPRGPLLQQHVGLLVVQRRRPATALLDLVVQVVQLLPQPLTI